jgi:hypothetical protein
MMVKKLLKRQILGCNGILAVEYYSVFRAGDPKSDPLVYITFYMGHFIYGMHLGGEICHLDDLETILFSASWQGGPFCSQLVIHKIPYEGEWGIRFLCASLYYTA